VALIGEGDASVVVVLADLRVAVVHDSGRDEFVARMGKRSEHVVPALSHFVAKVVQDDFLARSAQIVGEHGVSVRKSLLEA
jgi:hypothetical protein